MPSHHTPLHKAAAEAVSSATGVDATDIKVDVPKPEMGDLAVGCFAIAKAKGTNPAQLAKEIVAAFKPTDLLASATAAGPFVNFKVNRAAAFKWLIGASLGHSLLSRDIGAGKTICIDYGSPNISKHLAYHHIRSTTIGHALAQTFRALGYKVIGINHLGDWGTTHGALIAAFKKWGPFSAPMTVAELNALYVKFTEAKKQDPALDDEARAWFKKLENNDPEARALWQQFRDVSWAEYQEVYDLLGIGYDEVRGESAYEPDLPRVMEELKAKGLVVESEGAEVVFLDGEKTPILLRKQDGTTLYATRDVAAAEYRWNTYHPTRSLYVVDRGQSLHFRQLFKLLKVAGHDWAGVCEHIPFGLVRMGGKKTSTRLGNVVLMREVFQIAEDEVRERVAQISAHLPPDVVTTVARQVGIGAVVFANLASQREKDIDFDIDKAVSLDGDSGPYLQYSYARCASIARKAGVTVTSVDGVDFTKLTHDAEWAVAKKLVEYPEIVGRSADAAEPHVIAHYLLELAGEFSRWYTLGNGDASLRVLVEDAEVRRARLALVAAVQATMKQGLSLLGLAAPEQM
ncbi:MAG TPA: arginine--tRNA ligase [Kofleriaceae bacterium]|nr:arginine--tRNA ligase [Kofleriaceae bacterium]